MNDQQMDDLLRKQLGAEPKPELHAGLAQRVLNHASDKPTRKGERWLTLYWNAATLVAGLLLFSLPWPGLLHVVPFFGLPLLFAFTVNVNIHSDS